MSLHDSHLLQREDVAEGTLAFHFSRPDGFTFKPGQAIDLVLDAPGLSGDATRHAFSLVCAPSENELIIATRMRDSAFKRALGALPVGAKVAVDGPFGSLTLHNKVARPACFIAGGIGITPFMSMLRHAAGQQSNHRLALLYSNRRPEDAAFLAELQQLARRNPDFRLVATMTGMEKSAASWEGETGVIDAGLLGRVLADLPSAIVYLAGPPGMVEAMRAALEKAGFDGDDVRSEEFHGY